jgi:oxygen-independent coproporphyrinogen-3 oxidase
MSIQSQNDRTVGVYVHIPFCRRKCRYCDFYSITDLEYIPKYLEALGKEMELASIHYGKADTLYLGGGTPSLLKPGQINRIVDWATVYFNLDTYAEMTIEVNPATAMMRNLRDYVSLGFNRISIGVQSFNDQNLTFLGRVHNANQALAAVKAAIKAGFRNVGLDLIYGLPYQTPDSWKSDLLQALRLSPQHLACYMLSYEPGTPLYKELQAGRMVTLSDSLVADLFRITHDILGAADYEHYEISNFAQGACCRSIHNQKYWNLMPYIGFGPSSHSYSMPLRWWNHRSLDTYLADLKQSRLPVSGQERLTRNQQMIEALYLGLRKAEGIDLHAFLVKFQIDFKLYFQEVLELFSSLGWTESDNRRCRLTAEGMLFLDFIVNRMVELIN